jgi:hypothetical protein
MANEVDHFGSGWTDPDTGITYSASGEPLNAPDTGGSSHFDPSGQLILAGGEKVDMSAYTPITSPENYPGGFWGYYQHLIDTGQVNNDTQGLGGVAGYLRTHGYMVPLALMTAGAATGAMGGAAAAEGFGATSAGIGAGTEGAAGLGGVAGGVGAGGGAGAGTLAGLETTGAGGLSGGGGFVPTAGSGANFGIDAGANYGLASAAAPTVAESVAIPALETSGANGLIGGGGFTPTADASFAIEPTATYTTASTPIADVSAPIANVNQQAAIDAINAYTAPVEPTTPLADLYTPSEAVNTASNYGETVNIPSQTTSSFGTFTAPNTVVNPIDALTADLTGSVPSSIGMTGEIPSGVMVGDGSVGTTLGQTYMSAASGQLAVDTSGAAIPATSVGIEGFAPTTTTSITDALKTANQVKQAASTANTIAKLLGGTSTATKAAGTTGTTSGLNLSALASLLKPAAQTNSYVGQIKANQNPFTFTSAGQTAASPGMYDVSGSNLANALRKA